MINNNLPSIDTQTKYYYDDALEKVKGEVERYLSTSPLIIRQYTKHLMEPLGKLIRAISVLYCAEDNEGLIHRML